jgi:UDPglucose 6-dehydrogenase
MKTAIIGYGIVGKATHYSVLGHDPGVDLFDINRPYIGSGLAHDTIFVCVPTANELDIAELKLLCQHILEQQPNALVCIRSSVPVGFVSKELVQYVPRVVYFPEFLRERYWHKDSLSANWIIGCSESVQARLDHIFHAKVPVYLGLAEVEILKMMANAYAAMHVVFANHIYDLSTEMGARYDIIQACHDSVKHRDQSYLAVKPDLRAFGGKCLPKDLEFLISSFEKNNITQTLFNSIRDDNKKWPITIRNDQ